MFSGIGRRGIGTRYALPELNPGESFGCVTTSYRALLCAIADRRRYLPLSKSILVAKRFYWLSASFRDNLLARWSRIWKRVARKGPCESLMKVRERERERTISIVIKNNKVKDRRQLVNLVMLDAYCKDTIAGINRKNPYN